MKLWKKCTFFGYTFDYPKIELTITLKLVRNHVKLGVSLRVLYCVVDTDYGVGRSLGDCILALLEGRKYQKVKT